MGLRGHIPHQLVPIPNVLLHIPDVALGKFPVAHHKDVPTGIAQAPAVPQDRTEHQPLRQHQPQAEHIEKAQHHTGKIGEAGNVQHSAHAENTDAVDDGDGAGFLKEIPEPE